MRVFTLHSTHRGWLQGVVTGISAASTGGVPVIVSNDQQLSVTSTRHSPVFNGPLIQISLKLALIGKVEKISRGAVAILLTACVHCISRES